jgi:PIN domain nuclease of toxin-antitoxin system
VTVLDALAVVAYLRAEPGADEVAALLKQGENVMTASSAAEVVDHLVRRGNVHLDDVLADLGLLAYAGLTIVPVTGDDGLAAGMLRARHYDPESCAVSLGDCTAAAVALRRRVRLATSDPALAALVRAEGGDVYPLADGKAATA